MKTISSIDYEKVERELLLISERNEKRLWTPEAEALFIKFHGKVSIGVLAVKLHHNVLKIKNKIKELKDLGKIK